ncbi:hypothetical protein ABBQ32_005396 [Trebouxia sp. C0010 RCD-2024]
MQQSTPAHQSVVIPFSASSFKANGIYSSLTWATIARQQRPVGLLRKAWLVQVSHGCVWRLEPDTKYSSQQQAPADNMALSMHVHEEKSSHTRARVAEGKGTPCWL